ncbi:DUF3907 family protein [Paenibacillus yanchengensis]|uniref:DUF3907 family protein n=1 Tax=Paenibacillus yanchengensis TaxID=2035833 RepID=A0ABW4YKD4_9BACL
MLSANIRAITELTQKHLQSVVTIVEPFLNETNLSMLTAHDSSEQAVVYYKGILSDLRHLLVFTEVNLEKIWLILHRQQVKDEQANKVLYEVYHQVVNLFFYPTHESYTEDGRYAYSGQDAIRFRYKPDKQVRQRILHLAKLFEELRDELAYYESDYLSERRMQLQK